MFLRSWSTDFAGAVQGQGYGLDQEVDSFDEAAMVLAEDLLGTASPKFFTAAMREFLKNGEIDKLDEGNGIYWNVKVENSRLSSIN